ncbi:PTS sugar transporter subunit IIA [Actinomycetaceae bacterium TAE3-ERU4]|nr:PTS sugar transporter subunit IIA [Actinomycetaceae bacterium TAE3-ERU4]
MNSSFAGIITPECVKATAEVNDWRDAVKIVGGLLKDSEICTDGYVEAMQQAVIDLGPYMVVAPGVAMPHARPEAGVIKPGIAVATLTTPVNFGHKKNDPVNLVIGFAAIDKDAHLKTLQQIVALLQDEERTKAVRNAKTDEELYAALTH